MSGKKKQIKKLAKTVDGLVASLLEAIFEMGELLPDLFDRSFNTRQELKRYCFYGYPKCKIKENVKILNKRGCVNVGEKGTINLTKKGLIKVLANKVSAKKCSAGLRTIIVFDIEETKRRYRRFLRRLLISRGFKNIQKSVLVGDLRLSPEFNTLLKEMGLDNEVKIFSIEKLDF